MRLGLGEMSLLRMDGPKVNYRDKSELNMIPTFIDAERLQSTGAV